MKKFLFLRSTVSAIAFGYAMAAAPIGLNYDHGQLSFISMAHADDGGSESGGSSGSGESESDSSSGDSGHGSGSDDSGHDSGSHDSNDDSGSDDSSHNQSSSSNVSSSDDSSEHADPLTKALNKMLN